MICVFNFPCTFTFTYFIWFKIAAMEMTRNNVFSSSGGCEKSRLCCVLALKIASFSSADGQSHFLGIIVLPFQKVNKVVWCPFASSLHVTAFSIDQLLRRWRFVIMLARVSMRRCFNSLVDSGWYRGQVFVQYTHVPASVHKFCSHATRLFGGHQGWKKPRFFGIFLKVFRFFRFFKVF